MSLRIFHARIGLGLLGRSMLMSSLNSHATTPLVQQTGMRNTLRPQQHPDRLLSLPVLRPYQHIALQLPYDTIPVRQQANKLSKVAAVFA